MKTSRVVLACLYLFFYLYPFSQSAFFVMLLLQVLLCLLGKHGYDSNALGYYHNITPYNANYNWNQYYDPTNSSRSGIYDSKRYGYNENVHPSDCSIYDQRRINSCAYTLTKLDAFQQTVGLLEKITMWNFFKKSRDDLLNICDAYNLYIECIGGNAIKELCYSQEPFRSRYATTDNSLRYMCGEGYPFLYTSWYCIREITTSATYTECINAIRSEQKMDYYQKIDYYFLPNLLSACSSLQAYAHCIRPAVESRCGRQAYLAVLMTVRRSSEVLFPYCTLAATWYTYSVILQIVSAVIACFFSSVLY
ncbi:unnamed protein product [Litomosoides sigmodontis]|uniref:DUF19 domain-containing protein n=1 Tax=Litomosoides sigmodontis TaxID=42156 RepID=A0A3P6TS65_LITSI|nr:unnamed protein product [Litomosoides sigmodontis]